MPKKKLEPDDPVYVGSKKHKRWTPGGASGSICPDWTHLVDGKNWGGTEPDQWKEWPDTTAQTLLLNSVQEGSKRYAAGNGIAFCAHLTENRTWHGFPEPWRNIPLNIRDDLVKRGQVTENEIRRGIRKQKDINIKQVKDWALFK